MVTTLGTYRPAPATIATALLATAICGIAATASLLATAVLVRYGDPVSVVSTAAAAAFAGGCAVLCARQARVRVTVDEDGLLVVNGLFTVSLRWSEIDRVVALPGPRGARAILVDGRTVFLNAIRTTGSGARGRGGRRIAELNAMLERRTTGLRADQLLVRPDALHDDRR
jgi:Bacterial PH domain